MGRWSARSRRCSSTGSARHGARAGSMSAAARAFSRRRWSSFALRQVSTASTPRRRKSAPPRAGRRETARNSRSRTRASFRLRTPRSTSWPPRSSSTSSRSGRALAEMRRVARPAGLVAAYVWDFAEELSPSAPLRRAMRRLGADVPGSRAPKLRVSRHCAHCSWKLASSRSRRAPWTSASRMPISRTSGSHRRPIINRPRKSLPR